MLKKRYCFDGSIEYVILKHIAVCKMSHCKMISVFGKNMEGKKWEHEKHGLIFIGRIGKRRYIKIGNWVFGYLK